MFLAARLGSAAPRRRQQQTPTPTRPCSALADARSLTRSPPFPPTRQLELDALVVSATAFSLASHLYWGIWALIQARPAGAAAGSECATRHAPQPAGSIWGLPGLTRCPCVAQARFSPIDFDFLEYHFLRRGRLLLARAGDLRCSRGALGAAVAPVPSQARATDFGSSPLTFAVCRLDEFRRRKEAWLGAAKGLSKDAKQAAGWAV